MTGVSETDCQAALSVDPTIETARSVTSIDDRHLYRIVTKPFPPEQPLVFPTCRELDVTILEARRTADGLYLEARFPSRAVLREFETVGQEITRTVDVNRIYAEGHSPAVRSDPLTEKQRDALSLAVSEGYFDVPRRTNLTELAETVGISRQAFTRRLNRGLRNLLEVTLVTTES
ncbi:hypothetical protein EA472_00615 [Natrarchaeobius oligotrophus]|uniref:HTH bat-type domain-containing protein n=2 Tax=Natrarchaeobius TaxID=2501796 RepID=A0A3N6N3L1_NATCH|nr:hypothetical protein EA472_00615 [Natrarchaeobius chitinivorans]